MKPNLYLISTMQNVELILIKFHKNSIIDYKKNNSNLENKLKKD